MAFQSFASERFWQLYSELPAKVQRLADKQYELFRQDPWSWIGSHEAYNKLLRRRQ
jgi:hypothetical protein